MILCNSCRPAPAYVEFFLHRYVQLRVLDSFPTRRSSDLVTGDGAVDGEDAGGVERVELSTRGAEGNSAIRGITLGRSEEHTSELQSHSDLVCRLLLEKKNYQEGPTVELAESHAPFSCTAT